MVIKRLHIAQRGSRCLRMLLQPPEPCHYTPPSGGKDKELVKMAESVDRRRMNSGDDSDTLQPGEVANRGDDFSCRGRVEAL